ncbi:MAG TPA: cytochrome c peroxidase [Myxococcota bacterium]|nr:cytochrome c peroxidase [Myxococcota bacterium]HQK50360.1 cytochrome c peroxidase [Myxococcota bacterium]
MKKSLAVLVGMLALALLLPAINLFRGQPKGTVLTTRAHGDARVQRMAQVLEGPCADCHLEGVPRPFYAALPVASSLVERDKRVGLEWYDLAEALGPADGEPSEVGLAKLERVLEQRTMPPLPYLALHWRGGLSRHERDEVLRSIQQVRVALFAPRGLSQEVAGRVVHPLPESVPTDPNKVSLGMRLYHDTRLSGDNTISCASCHALNKGGTDQARVSTGIRGQLGGINAPTTFNAVFQFAQFWDGRASDLQDQAAGPPENPIEMGTTFAEIVAKLQADEEFRREFEASYPEGLSKATITHAIAEFEKTLVTPGSPFDRFLLGQHDALPAQAKAGWEVFQREGCATCHVGRLLGGRSYEKMGRAKDYFAARGNPSDADLGRYAVTRQEQDRHRFKVPTLRNIARTFPYFHDGSVTDLKDAVQKMAEFQFGSRLKDSDADRIVAFLESLTGSWNGNPL